MPRQPLILIVALSLARVFTLVAFLNFLYLRDGYDLSVSFGESDPSVYHVDFPQWRRIANVCLWLVACGCVWLFYIGNRHVMAASFAILAVAFALGASDIYSYGSMGSPRSFLMIAALLALAAAAWLRSRLTG